jgi:hypothetical protein
MKMSVKSCIFCGEAKLTKEHVFPNWLREFVPRTQQKTRHLTNFNIRDTQNCLQHTRNSLGKLNRPGDMGSQRLRVVCGKCNNGWMSRLQAETKPIMVPLITNNWWEIDSKSQLAIASWAAMFTMVLEFADIRTAAISQETRHTFAKNPLSLDKWIVSFGVYEGQNPITHFHHWGGGFYSKNAKPKDTKCNMQITTAVAGRLLLQTFYSTSPGDPQRFFTERYFGSLGLQQIWPNLGKTITQPDRSINENNHFKVSTTMRDFLKSPISEQIKILHSSASFSIFQAGDVMHFWNDARNK